MYLPVSKKHWEDKHQNTETDRSQSTLERAGLSYGRRRDTTLGTLCCRKMRDTFTIIKLYTVECFFKILMFEIMFIFYMLETQ